MISWRTFSKFISFLVLICLLSAGSLETSSAVQDQALADADIGDPFADLVVGAPGETLYDSTGNLEGAGIVHIIFGYPQGLGPQGNQTWDQDMDFSQDKVERGDAFGFALASGDFNGDGRYDVAVGAPFEDIGQGTGLRRSAGGVHVIYGSSSGGLTSANNQFWHQDSPDVEDMAEEDDNFGKTLAVGNFNGDDYDDLAIGVPFENFEYGTDIKNGGSVIVLYGSAAGLHPTAAENNQMWHQDSYDAVDIADKVEEYDVFGSALGSGDFDDDGYDDLAVGALGEDSSSKANIGVVHILYGTADGLSAARNQQWEQYDWKTSESEKDDYFGKPLAVGNFDGDRYDDLAIGVPKEDIELPSGTIEDAGAVNVLFGTQDGLSKNRVRFVYQDGEDIEEQPEEDDQFGGSLAAVDFTGHGKDYLVVGVPYEDLGQPVVANAGAFHVLKLDLNGGFMGSSSHFFHQGRDNIPDELGLENAFGYALAEGDFNGDGREDLAVGNPYDRCEQSWDGSVVVIYNTTWDWAGAASPQHWCQGGVLEEKAERDDNFGWGLVSIPGSGALPFRNFLPNIFHED